MAQNLLSIDIRQDIVCALLLAQGAGGASLQRCALSVVVEGNHLEALQEVLQQMGYNGEPCRICLGAETFFYRNLSFPFSDKRKIDKILPIELEDNLPVDVGDVLVDTFVAGKNETESTVVAAMIDRDHLRWQLDELASVGIDPQIVTISGVQTALLMAQKGMHSDFILLDIGCRRANMFVTVDKRMRLIRSMPFDDGSGASFVIDRNSQQVSARKPEELDATFKLLGREMRNALLGLENIELHLPVFLTGALANAKGVQRYLGKNLDCEIGR
uniref:type II secretion system protein GspL n=1 Tax=Candidatus Electrothrix sp. TaxID=2170559 RepID=UPI004057A53A